VIDLDPKPAATTPAHALKRRGGYWRWSSTCSTFKNSSLLLLERDHQRSRADDEGCLAMAQEADAAT
jgi:hypothetical protein